MKMLPPQNIDAEKSLLGAILTEQSVMYDIMEILNPDDFYRADHGLIFKAMVKLFVQSKPIDIITVTEELSNSNELDKVGGTQYIISLTEDVPIVSNASQYASIISDKSVVKGIASGNSNPSYASLFKNPTI